MTVIAKEPRADLPPPAEPPPDTVIPESGNFNQVIRLLVVLALVTVVFLLAGLGDLLLFIAILILVVMLHELGHFATAKWAGMKVTEYFVGFGPRLWSVRRGETEYGVKAIPAGGYVRITGFTVLEDVPDEDEPRAYRQQPFGKRMIVGSAGSAMHFLIAFVLALIVVFAFGTPTNNLQVVGLEHLQGGAASPAQKAGLASGDVIVSVNGKPLQALNDPSTLTSVITRSSGVPVTLGVERDGHLRQVTVTPADARGVKVDGTVLAPAGAAKPHGFIGVTLNASTQSVNPIRAIGLGATNVWQTTTGEIAGIGHIFSPTGLSSFYHQVSNSKDATQAANHPDTSPRPSSIIGIADIGVQAQQAGLLFLLEFLITVNIAFGLLNMLPMIPFDGGHVAVAGYEWIRTKKGQPYYRADISKLFPVVFVFMAFLAVFVLGAVYLDVAHPIKNIFP
jgi:membrane-associated protease RseP (regulator of RpoE activity)